MVEKITAKNKNVSQTGLRAYPEISDEHEEVYARE